MKNKSAVKLALAITTAITLTMSSEAMATKKLYSPYVEKGEIELEYRGGYKIDKDNSTGGDWTQKYAIGYGISDMWFTEIYAEFKNDTNTDLQAIEIENKFMLTNPGRYWADLGILSETEFNTDGRAHKTALSLLLTKDVYKFTHMANIGFEREFGSGASNETDLIMAVGSRYRYKPSFQPGFEAYSNFGSLTNGKSFTQQNHIAGPVIYGKLGKFKYDVGALFGMSDSAPDITLKALFEYEWRF